MKIRSLLLLPLLLLAACASTPQDTAPAHPEAAIYDPSIDATRAVDAAMAQAGEDGKLALIVLGGNWCHDSRAFAGWVQSEQLAGFVAEHFVPVFINVGLPQTGDGFNLHIARRFGIETIEGTPTVLIIAPDGSVLNLETAQDWRNSASRSAQEIQAELASFVSEPQG